jgi:hypothetical protein
MRAQTKLMKAILIGLCALSLLAGLSPKVAAQNITITVGPATDDSYWVWNDDYQCWLWTGPEFQGDYQGHPYAYWHGRHEGGGDRNHRPGKGESDDGVRPVNNGDVEQPKALQPRTEVQQRTAEQPNSDVEKSREQPKPQVEQPKAEQPKSEAEKPKEQQAKPQVEKPKGEEKAKTEKPKQEEKKDDSKPKGE